MLPDKLQHTRQGSFYFYVAVTSAIGPGHSLVMARGSMCNKFQELLHLPLEGKGQIDVWGDRAVLTVRRGLCSPILRTFFSATELCVVRMCSLYL